MTLTDAEMETIFTELELPEPTRAFVRAIRAGKPVRRRNKTINVTGRYPSVKMGMTIQYESRSGEGLACMLYEGDDQVLEFYDQPYTFRVRYQAPGASDEYIEHTPDFLVIRRYRQEDGTITHSIGFEEWRERGRMEGLRKDDPGRWLKLLTGDWTQLPIEQHLMELKLDYRIRLIDATPPLLARNYDLLSDFFLHSFPVDPALQAQIREMVGSRFGLTLAQLRTDLPNAGVDDVLALIASGQLFANLAAALLTDHTHVKLFTRPELRAIAERPREEVETPAVLMEAGAKVRLGTEDLEILSTSADTVYVVSASGRGSELAVSDFQRWAATGKLTGISTGADDFAVELNDHDGKALVEAHAHFQQIEPYLRSGTAPHDRTLRRWLAAYRASAALSGDGFAGLVQKIDDRGNRVPRLAEDTETIAAEVIKDLLLRPDQLALRKAHALYVRACDAAGVHPMALSTFHLRYRLLTQVQRLRARTGSRAANGASMHSRTGALALPPHGDRAFARVHIDHTTLDLETCDSVTGANLGRPECTLVIDAFTRRILVGLVLYQKPSAATDMLALRELVREYHQMPTTIVVDGGSDFSSRYFEMLCARLKTKVENRRTGHPRDGAPVEAAFKKLDTDLVWTLRGNTQIRKNVRAMSPEHDPSKRAVWTLGALQAELDRYIAFHNAQVIPTLGGSPQQRWDESMAASGPRAFKQLAYTIAFRALTALQPKQGPTARVTRDGVRINTLDYWCDAFTLPGVDGSNVEVRYEPLNGLVAYARVQKVWHVVTASYPELQGRSEKEIAIATQQLRRRLGKGPSMHELAAYLEQVQAREADLTAEQQRRVRRGAEQTAVIDARTEVAALPDAIPAAVPTVAAVELELSGYEPTTDDELRRLLEDSADELEAA